LRILILHEDKRGYGKGGGAESMLRDMTTALERAGHKVQWWQNDEPLEQAVEQFRPDVCHIMTIHNFIGLAPAVWLQQQRIPHVWSLMDYWMFCGNRMLLMGDNSDESCPAVAGVCDPVQCRSHRAPVRYMEVVTQSPIIALNEYTAAIYERNGIRVYDVGPLGVDHEYFCPDPSKREPKRVMTHSAWPEYPTKGMHILKAALEQTGIKGHLVTHAPREKVRDELQRAEVHVFPSCYQETFGLCLAEARACGCACIASDVAGARAQIHHGYDGLLVPPRNVDALAAALTMLMNDDAMREELGRAARQSIEERGTLAHMARTYTRIYRRVIDEFKGVRKDAVIRSACAEVRVSR